MKYGPYIILEGPDGTGKTTLARALEGRGFNYVHCGPPTEPALGFYTKRARGAPGPTVIDRFHVGSYCYGMAFRNTPDLTLFENWLLEGFLYAHGAMLVYCIVPPEAVEQNLSRGPDSADAKIYEVPEKRELLRRLYDEQMAETELPVVRYDYTARENALADTASDLALWSAHQDLVLPTSEFDAIGNTVSPRYVFVADRPNWYDGLVREARRRGWTRDQYGLARALFSRWGLASGGASSSWRYLHQTVKSAGLRFEDFCLFNSIQGDGRRALDLRRDPCWYARRDVVALGRNASEVLRLSGIRHRTVPHPQHVRRFHYKHFDRYAAALTGKAPWECGTEYCRAGAW